MLNSISWASYFIALSISLCLYYAFVLVRYYSHDLQKYAQLLKSRKGKFLSFGNQNKKQPAFEISENRIRELEQDDSIPKLLLQLQSTIMDGAARKFPKEELLLAIKLHLRNHGFMTKDSDKEIINKFIKAQFENYCSIHLSVEEGRVLWVD